MKCKRFFILVFVILCCSFSVFAAVSNVDSFINGSSRATVTNNKIINYINMKAKISKGTAYCIGRDKINYYETFTDGERDYFGLAFSERLKQNGALTEQQKQLKQGSISFRYTHNPKVYDNPAAISGLSGNWFDCTIQWDTDKGKWKIVDDTGVLFTEPTDLMRGEWKIELKGKDATGKELFDKEAVGYSIFRVHKAPVPKFLLTENMETATLRDDGSYDIDYQYSKNSRKNAAGDRQYSGIKEFYWMAKVGGSWIDVGKGPVVTFQKNGQEVTDYMLMVEDYDGAFSTSSASSLFMDAPSADFYYKAGSQTTQYFYEGNKGHETVQVSSSIAWNDEGFTKPPYNTSGARTEKWTAVKTGDFRNTATAYNTEILKNKYTQILQGKRIETRLEVKNKFDKTDIQTKAAMMIPLTLKDRTGTEGTTVCKNCYAVTAPKKPFLVGTTAKLIVENNNDKVDFEDLKMVLNAPSAGINNQEMALKDGQFRYEIKLQDSVAYHKTWWDCFDYSFKIYSKRTGEYLHEVPGRIFIHTPVTVKGQINGSDQQQEINTDEPISITAKTEKYAETVSVKFPVVVIVNGKEILPGTPIPLIPDSSHTSWSGSIIISGDAIEEDTKIKADFEVAAYNKRDKAVDSVEVQVVAYRLENLRITQVRDFQLENYYKGPDGRFQDVEMNVNQMAVDKDSFAPFLINGLTKGYQFAFKIDSVNFNQDADSIVITPAYYSVNGNARDAAPKYGYWIDSNKKVWKLGQGGHKDYEKVVLTKDDRSVTVGNKATWNGKFMIPGTAFLSSSNDVSNALEHKTEGDIIVAFHVVGYKNGVPKYDYNIKQWPKEREREKEPYQIGDVIRYDGKKSNLDDLKVIRVRP